MYSAIQYAGNGVQTDFVVTFPFISTSHVEVSVDGVTTPIASWPTAGTLRLAAAPANGAVVWVRRNSSRSAKLVSFVDSSTITDSTLNTSTDQLLYVAQEALDQATTGSYFSTDANGARVVNVQDPVNNTDAATKGWVQTYVSGITADGNNLLPLNNTWTGRNTFSDKVSIGSAQFTLDYLTSDDLLELKKGYYSNYTTNHATAIGYGFACNVKRDSGYPLIVGAQINVWGQGSWTGDTHGIATEVMRLDSNTGLCTGIESSVVNTNGVTPSDRICALDLVYKNRGNGEAATIGGLSNDYYNSNSLAMQISAQPRGSDGARSGFNRGVLFRIDSLDEMKLVAYSGTKTYNPGDYVTNGGHRWQARDYSTGVTPVNGPYWIDLGAGTTKKAIGIDLSPVGATCLSRMDAGIKFMGAMKFLWDTEEQIATNFDPVTGRWSLWNTTAERMSVDVTTGDIEVNLERRILATKSSVHAHRNGSVFILAGGAAWTQLSFPTEVRDPRNEFDAGGTGRFTATVPGDYLIVFQAQTEGLEAANQRVYAGVFLNGAVYKAADVVTHGSGQNATATCTCIVPMVAGDYIDARALNTNASAISLTGEPTATFLQISKVQ